ncbi:hypothetical protein [Mucilaginibacter lappiensis]|uniref:hypothetical protein n=1 Tax=Mucilaginibacter lappiensis TaxID=354630 RepID=UPI003D2047F6
MASYFTVNTVSEFVCLITSLICLTRDKCLAWRLLVFYMLLNCATEVAGIYIRVKLHHHNYPVYNLLLLAECGTVTFFFYYLFKGYKNIMPYVIIWLVIFMAVYITELILNQMGQFLFYTASVMSIVFVFTALYFYYLMLMDEKYMQLSTYAPFWWVNGALFFYFGSTTCNIFFNYLIKDTHILFGNSIRYIVFSILNIILYGFWSYAFICRYLQRIYTPSSD